MSCYLCSRKVWLNVLEAWRRGGVALCNWADEEVLSNAWYEIISANYIAVRIRYPKDPEMGTLEEEETKLPTTSELLELSQKKTKELFDSIQEYQYQCAEGKNFADRPGYYKCNWVKDEWLRQLMEKCDD